MSGPYTRPRLRSSIAVLVLLACAVLLLMVFTAGASSPLVAYAQAAGPEPGPTVVLRKATSSAAAGPLQATVTNTPDLPPSSTPPIGPSATDTAWPPPSSTPTSTASGVPSPTAPAATSTLTAPAPGAPTATAAVPETPTVPVSDDRPILVLVDSDVSPGSPSSGSDIRVTLQVKNVGRTDAEHVLLTLSSGVFLPIDKGAELYKEEIDAGETRPFKAKLKVDSAAVSGVYSLNISMRWGDAGGGEYSTQTSIGISVRGEQPPSRPLVTVSNAQAPSRAVPGVPFSVSFELANIGGGEARNVVVDPAGGPLALQGVGQSPIHIPAGGTATVALRLVAAPVAEPGAVQQSFSIRYDDEDGSRFSDNYQLGLYLTDNSALGPLPVIASYSFGETLHPGQVFELELTILNVGARDALRTRITLGAAAAPAASGASSSPGGSAFAPLGTGNVRYIGRLASGEEEVVVQKMVVDGAASPGVYQLPVSFEYVDPDGAPLTSGEVIGLLVSRQISLQVNPVDAVTTTFASQPFHFSVEVINAGTSSVNVGNVEVVPGRYMEVTDGAVTYVGPLDSGAIFPVDAVLLPKAPTERATVTVVVHYTDDFRQQQVLEQQFEFTIEAAPEVPLGEFDEQQLVADPMALRVIKGFLGLGASPKLNVQPAG